jgi:hypothetical protein
MTNRWYAETGVEVWLTIFQVQNQFDSDQNVEKEPKEASTRQQQ